MGYIVQIGRLIRTISESLAESPTHARESQHHRVHVHVHVHVRIRSARPLQVVPSSGKIGHDVRRPREGLHDLPTKRGGLSLVLVRTGVHFGQASPTLRERRSRGRDHFSVISQFRPSRRGYLFVGPGVQEEFDEVGVPFVFFSQGGHGVVGRGRRRHLGAADSSSGTGAVDDGNGSENHRRGKNGRRTRQNRRRGHRSGDEGEIGSSVASAPQILTEGGQQMGFDGEDGLVSKRRFQIVVSFSRKASFEGATGNRLRPSLSRLRRRRKTNVRSAHQPRGGKEETPPRGGIVTHGIGDEGRDEVLEEVQIPNARGRRGFGGTAFSSRQERGEAHRRDGDGKASSGRRSFPGGDFGRGAERHVGHGGAPDARAVGVVVVGGAVVGISHRQSRARHAPSDFGNGLPRMAI
mmetsp:Transcript_861/g.1902  ORF Transcript_861/g.1902 Transcript_861/m.1902 type:complete len:408 (-) Transcript_861:736-1959(-)